MRVRFSVNTSPFAGREGRFVTSRQIDERLRREALGNVSIRVERTGAADIFEVAGRGELQIGDPDRDDAPRGLRVRVSRPEIIPREIDGVALRAGRGRGGRGARARRRRGDGEALAARKGRMRRDGAARRPRDARTSSCRAAACSATAASSSPTRAARACCTAPCAATSRSPASSRGAAVGAIVATEAGKTTAYALFSIQERATLFVGAGVPGLRGAGRRREPPRRRHERERRARQEAHQHPRRRARTRTRVLSPPRERRRSSGRSSGSRTTSCSR